MAGQIIPRGEGVWLVRIFLGRDAQTQKRKFHNKTIHGTKKDAQRYLTAALRERDLGIFAEPSRERLDRYLAKWLETAVKPKVKARTHGDYESMLKRYVEPDLGSLALSKITPLHIQGIYAKMLAADEDGEGLSARTVRYTHAVLKSAFKQAVKWRLIPQNPADHVELPKQKHVEMSVLDSSQARTFLEQAKEDRLSALFSVAITTGLRPSEYLALKWTDVNWDAGTISISRTLEWIKGGGWFFDDVKRPRSRRVVRLQDRVLGSLREHLSAQDEERTDAAESWTDAGLIFTTKNGTPVDERNLAQQNFARLLKDSGLPSIRLYDLRHTAATLGLSAGVSAKVVSEMLGHSSVAFTMDTYAHVLPHMQDSAAVKVESLLYPEDQKTAAKATARKAKAARKSARKTIPDG